MPNDFSPLPNARALPVMRPRLLDGVTFALQAQALSLHYGQRQVLHELNLAVPVRQVTALVGPSGCGKSTFLRCCNRLNDELEDCRSNGRVLLGGEDIRARELPVPELRRRVGMVFQRPNPFPLSIYDNVAYGLRLAGLKRRRELDERIESVLQRVGLWDEVAARLHEDALTLSSGQQQRLVIARALAVEPEILLLDEPAAMLDPISTLRFEELLDQLAQRYTVLLVTHNMQQAARVADYTAFMYQGRVLEFGDTDSLFTNPQRRETEDYITGKFR